MDRQCRPHNILLGVTGSVAAVKAPELACQLVEQTCLSGATVKVLLTAGGRTFWDKAQTYDPTSWSQLQAYSQQENSSSSPRIQIIDAQDEWKTWQRLGDPVEHIELRNWADVLVLAPLSAHTLAKLAHGLCDDTLSCVARAWKFPKRNSCLDVTGGDGKPVILAPAMNTAMWDHPLTKQQLDTFQSFGSGIVVVPPQSKLLACGDVGNGALASVDAIVESVRQSLEN